MTVTTIFQRETGYELGQVEVSLQPGLPQLLLVGLPDTAMKECAVKIKSALRASGLNWPSGHQIVVNLRPSYQRKSSSGADLAIALAILAQTQQLSPTLRQALESAIVYGEVGLDGRVFAPVDMSQALRACGDRRLLTGPVADEVREGQWWELTELSADSLRVQGRSFDWSTFWRRPEIPDIELHPEAARSLLLAAHLQLHVLVAGPQGSGKTTWARALHALSAVPDRAQALARADLLGDAELELRWRPCEQPHHSVTAQALVGCGFPMQPGVITRAHGGILLLDEFLEFPVAALEALREPVESGVIELARRGWRRRLPAKFQLVATTNLCPCGKLNPERRKQHSCPHSLLRCRSVCERLSGPVLDRFDMMVFSHQWQQRSTRSVRLRTLLLKLEELNQFAAGRPLAPSRLPEHWDLLDLSHRRRHSLLKVARGLADLDSEAVIREHHYSTAAGLVLAPITQVASIFA